MPPPLALSVPGLWLGGIALAVLIGLGFWVGWRWREPILRRLGFFQTVTVQMNVMDPYGLHLRRCKDLIYATRNLVGYQIYMRNHGEGAKHWANARSIISLQTMGVPRRAPGEPPPTVDVRIAGFKPSVAVRAIRKVLEEDPYKYLSVHDLAQLAATVGGQVSAKMPLPGPVPLHRRIRRVLGRIKPWIHP
jgi:phosphotransferase system HPr-like phosphotransfer protein